jgi:purine-binding chemotaxis protein CheW
MEDDPKKTETDQDAQAEEQAWDQLFGGAETTGLVFATEETYHKAQEERSREENVRQLLAFKVGGEDYAVDLHEVKEILKHRPVTSVPRTKDFVAGVISVRGVVMPVVDLARRLGLGSGEPTSHTRILVVGDLEQRYGLVVDGVMGVERGANLRVEPPPGVISGSVAEFFEGIGRMGSKMFILLRLEAILDFEAEA